MGILRMLQRRRARKAFGKYLSPEVIEKVLRETCSEIRPPEVQQFQFVAALGDDTNPQDVPAMISKVTGGLSRRIPCGRSRPSRTELLAHVQEWGSQVGTLIRRAAW
jgi:hypothetical protein